MTEYTVTWTIQVEADSHTQAAEKALEIQRDLDSIANVFTVVANDDVRTVDLTIECEEILLCLDCLLFVANGDESEDSDWSEDALEANWPSMEWDISPGDSEKDEEFSRSACEGCGSPLGGSRHHAIAMKRV